MNKSFLKSLFYIGAAVLSTGTYAGFSVSGGQIYDGNGNQFVIRGINHAHAWYPTYLESSLSGISSYGANAVRVVLSNGQRWSLNSGSEVSDIINKAKQQNLVAILEVHDTTGYGEDSSAASLSSAVDYWISIKDYLIGQEDYVMINIGNEPFGNGSAISNWTYEHQNAITRLRNAGLSHILMVDAPNWGQDWQSVMKDNAYSVFSADPDQNVVFSVHMYEVYQNYTAVNDYVSSFVNNGLPLVIGEFASTHKGEYVDASSIMERAQSLGLGYIGWSWSGNNSSTADLDIIQDWDSGSLSTWGDMLINSSNGIRNTSKIASVFGTTNTGDGGSDEGYPTCSSADSDPDGDGWGWENNQSCIVSNTNTDTDTDSGSSEYPTCSDSSSDPDGDGWGWENNQSCIVVESSDSAQAANGYPYCSSANVDPDGDGWGWENSSSCVVRDSAADS